MRSTDAKGHATSQNIKIEPLLAHAVKVIVNNESLPYRSPADFARDAMAHRVQQLMEKDPAFGMEAWSLWAEWKLAVQGQKWAEKIQRDQETIKWYHQQFDNEQATTEEMMGLLTTAEQAQQLMPGHRAEQLGDIIRGARERLAYRLGLEANNKSSDEMEAKGTR